MPASETNERPDDESTERDSGTAPEQSWPAADLWSGDSPTPDIAGPDAEIHADGTLSEHVGLDVRGAADFDGKDWGGFVTLTLRTGMFDIPIRLDEAQAVALRDRIDNELAGAQAQRDALDAQAPR